MHPISDQSASRDGRPAVGIRYGLFNASRVEPIATSRPGLDGIAPSLITVATRRALGASRSGLEGLPMHPTRTEWPRWPTRREIAATISNERRPTVREVPPAFLRHSVIRSAYSLPVQALAHASPARGTCCRGIAGTRQRSWRCLVRSSRSWAARPCRSGSARSDSPRPTARAPCPIGWRC